jgi:FtsH-binding integral membrane protein
MDIWSDRLIHPSAASHPIETGFDSGLRRYISGIYRNMALGLGITGLVAFAVASIPALYQPIFGTPLKWVAIFAPLAFVMVFSFQVERMSVAAARTAFLAFAAVMGVSMASIFLVFTGQSIALAFLMAAALFLGLSLWGYTTNVDLSRWSTVLLVGLIGAVVASIVNLFLQSSMLQLVFSIAGILVFTGLTAWDTQRLKSLYLAYGQSEAAEKLAVMGALSLYLNLINLFQLLLTFVGQRRD